MLIPGGRESPRPLLRIAVHAKQTRFYFPATLLEKVVACGDTPSRAIIHHDEEKRQLRFDLLLEPTDEKWPSFALVKEGRAPGRAVLVATSKVPFVKDGAFSPVELVRGKSPSLTFAY